MAKRILGVAFVGVTFLVAASDAQNAPERVEANAPHCGMIQAGSIQVIVGDASRKGSGGTQYCGIWSLTSKGRRFNAFGNSLAGLIPCDLRAKKPRFEAAGPDACVLRREADATWPVDAVATYRVRAPHYVDFSLRLTDREDVRRPECDFREVTMVSYANSPEDPRIHFLEEGKWRRYISPEHGRACHVPPGFVSEDRLEVWPDWNDKPVGRCWIPSWPYDLELRPFKWDPSGMSFDDSFFYTRLGEMVLIYILDQPERVRLYCSPRGGGASLLPGQMSPAWDFDWIIPAEDYEVDREYTFHARLVYKKFVSDEDVLAEVRRGRKALTSENAGKGSGIND